jgi:hypothetical protein
MGGCFLIQVAPQVRIPGGCGGSRWKGIDAIAQLCREKLNADPFSEYLFIFRTRRGTAIRLLQYDGQGFWLATKYISTWERCGNRRRDRALAGAPCKEGIAGRGA